jgi:hypothetical protein
MSYPQYRLESSATELVGPPNPLSLLISVYSQDATIPNTIARSSNKEKLEWNPKNLVHTSAGTPVIRLAL